MGRVVFDVNRRNGDRSSYLDDTGYSSSGSLQPFWLRLVDVMWGYRKVTRRGPQVYRL
jgi:hypothetical protein